MQLYRVPRNSRAIWGAVLIPFPLPGCSLFESSNYTDISGPLERSSSTHPECSASMCSTALQPSWSPMMSAASLFGVLDRNVHIILLFLTTTLWGRYYRRAHFTDKETDSETLRSMPKVTQLVNGEGGGGPGPGLSQLMVVLRRCICLSRCWLLLYKWGRELRGVKSDVGSKKGYFTTRKYHSNRL